MNQPSNNIADPTLLAKYRRLGDILSGYNRVIVAYSGGVDSVFLLKAALDSLGRDNVIASIGVSPSLAESEYKEAIEIAKKLGANLQVVHPQEMANPSYRANPTDRCFHCKSELYALLNRLAEQKGFEKVVCGNNADDLDDFRPGLAAAEQLNVAGPLAMAKLTKQDIRNLSRHLGLDSWSKPAQPCLASRMTYGLEITPDRLKQIESAEDFLRKLGLSQLRVRHHGPLARIEVGPDDIEFIAKSDCRIRIVEFFKKLGFNYVSLDLEGFRSGSGNEILGK